jgi:hypothetical protein
VIKYVTFCRVRYDSSADSIPVLVAGDGQIVDVLGEVEGRGCWVRLVVEGPVGFGAVVAKFRVRKIDPVLRWRSSGS